MAGSLLCHTHLVPIRSRPAPSSSSTWRVILFAGITAVVAAASETDNLPMIASAPRRAGAVLQPRHLLPTHSSTRILLEENVDIIGVESEVEKEDYEEHDDGEEKHMDGEEHEDDHNEEEKEKQKPWGQVLIGTLIVNLATLVGVVVLIPGVRRMENCCLCISQKTQAKRGISTRDANIDAISKRNPPPPAEGREIDHPLDDNKLYKHQFVSNNSTGSGGGQSVLMDIAIPSAAAGALLACAAFLIIPESLAWIKKGNISALQPSAHGDGHEDHSEDIHRFLQEEDHSDDSDDVGAIVMFGVSLLGGFLIPLVLGALFPQLVQYESDPERSKAKVIKSGSILGQDDHEAQLVDEEPQGGALQTATLHQNIDYRLCASLLLGDGFHNFGDGIFIGIGFLICSRSVAISIMAATLYHEIVQELADFFLLTRQGGLSIATALALNFVSGLSVMLGGIIILSVNLTAQAVGVILGMAAGVYIYNAVSECLPRVDAAVGGWEDRLMSIFMFIVGSVPIGLVMLNHQHCEG